MNQPMTARGFRAVGFQGLGLWRSRCRGEGASTNANNIGTSQGFIGVQGFMGFRGSGLLLRERSRTLFC